MCFSRVKKMSEEKKEIMLGQLVNFFPAPVVIVASRDTKGRNNAMTAAWFGVACSVPPILSVGIRPQRLSDEIIKETKCFTINIPDEKFLEKTDLIGTISGKEKDKFKELNLEFEDAKTINAPLLKGCPVNYECSLKQVIPLGAHDLFLGEGKRAVAGNDFLNGPESDVSKMKPLLLFTNSYFSLGKKLETYGFSRVKK